MIFTGRLSVTRYLKSGQASIQRWQTEPADAGFSAAGAASAQALASFKPRDGEVRRLDGRKEAQLICGARSDVVTLTATIRAGAAPLMREHWITDGALVRTASNDDLASRAEMLLAFLRLSGRTDAEACFEAASRDPAFHLRWAAMREWLALDARAALPRLAEIAWDDPNAEVRAAAILTLDRVQPHLKAAECLV